MKKSLLLLTLTSVSCIFAQKAPVDFEAGGNGANWTWATFEAPPGENNPDFTVASNPSVDMTNGSANVAKMVISYGTAASWGSAGCESKHGSDIGNFAVTDSNNIVKMMIYQEGFAAPVALKFATSSGGAYPEIVVRNTVANEWVEVEFDMSRWIGGLGGDNPDQIIFFPSYAARAMGHTVYFDNVFFTNKNSTGTDDLAETSVKIFPNPSVDSWTIETKKAQVSSLILCDAMGKRVLSLDPKDTKMVIDGSALQPGLYFASLITEAGVKTFKLIKK